MRDMMSRAEREFPIQLLSEFWFGIGVGSYRIGNTEIAEEFLQKVWDLRATESIDSLVPILLARMQWDRGEELGAIAVLSDYLEQEEDPGIALKRLGDYHRLKKEDRLIKGFSGDNTDCALNFKPRMNAETLIKGYKNIMATIYSPKQYYERVKTFLNEYKPSAKRRGKLKSYHVVAFVRSLWILGLREKGRRYYWKLFITTLLKRPRSFPVSMSLAVYGYHFRKVSKRV